MKLEKSGKWVVSRFEKEHNHPLVVTEQGLSTYVSFSITHVTVWVVTLLFITLALFLYSPVNPYACSF